MEKNIQKTVYIVITESHIAVQQKLTQHCKSTILQFKKPSPKSKKEMIQMNLQNRKRLTDLENKLMVTGAGGRGKDDGRKG